MLLRTRRFGPSLLLVPVALLFACSSESNSGMQSKEEVSSTGGSSNHEEVLPTGGDWEALVTGDWTLPAGGEDPDHCVKVTLEEDIYIKAIRPIHPPGTHHTFVAISDTAEHEGCTTAVGTGTLVYAAGIGSPGLTLPEGVAIKLPAGKVLNLSLHIYNTTTGELHGTSGMEIQKVDAHDGMVEAGSLLAGPLELTLPPGQVTTIKNVCTISAPTTAFAIFPHMHQLGRHLKTTVTVGGETSVVHDAEYDFEEQYQLPIDPIEFNMGDQIETECTYENPGPNTVTFGESSDTEMCFSVFFRYPAGNTLCI